MNTHYRRIIGYMVFVVLCIAGGSIYHSLYGTHYAVCGFTVGIGTEARREIVVVTTRCTKGECASEGGNANFAYDGGGNGGYLAPNDSCIAISKRDAEKLGR